MVKLSELRKYDKQAYDLLMGEVKHVHGGAWWKDCVRRDTNVAGAVLFKDTTQGSDYWWEVSDRVERIIQESDAKV